MTLAPDAKAIKAHLSFLFDTTDEKFWDGKIEISILTASKYFSLNQIADAVAQAVAWNEAGQNVYVCPALLVPDVEARISKREQETGKPGRAKGEDFYASNVVWCDIDRG